MRQRRLNEEEQALWSAFAQGIAPLRTARHLPPASFATGRAPAATPPDPDARPGMDRADIMARITAGAVHAVHATASHAVTVQKGKGGAFEIGVRRPGLDDTSWRGLVSGKLRPARRLDLHGQVAQTAFHRLHAFIIQAHADNVRCIEIITGLGSGHNGGILRRELPFWLGRGDLGRLILAVVHPHSANQGAVRVLLRRPGRASR
ncbi:DNA mismatch repair protein [Komagataeibacter rhaeticus]|uniref:DNA mismatch repair protein n=1 Tax=Komagataeibacter rhaeticus TaxID=215221 RepID=A0A858JLY8_9PROT|nr:Smr/MutS family protein [Komagataeibacter rhaeticus]ATU74418.1 DNA mismatch repair protein [Komagataeibacter xylinus]EGG75986.1 putative small MutS protein [Gluconacetobacter sp. SXCC-1]MBL7240582.1 Smr/MutS family protein [Komagataeibacter rhaeticus]PYD54170.1 DNA mismatch repair protein [Komagataeibacter rhaeticus]QIP34737.1 DNA mismatch repair protein [Komagataeibacter rhaeticus]